MGEGEPSYGESARLRIDGRGSPVLWKNLPRSQSTPSPIGWERAGVRVRLGPLLMKLPQLSNKRGVSGGQFLWITPVFFALWTGLVALSVWSLLGRDSSRPDLLIALD